MIETRVRKGGKQEGNVYKVFISPEGAKIYSRSKAVKAGMPVTGAPTDGRKSRHKKKQ